MRYPRIGISATVFHPTRKEHVLVVKRACAPYKGHWAFPGGKLEYGESITSAVEREVNEETGICVHSGHLLDTTEVLPSSTSEHHYVLLHFSATALSLALKPGSDATDAQWVPFHALQHDLRTVPGLLPILRLALHSLAE